MPATPFLAVCFPNMKHSYVEGFQMSATSSGYQFNNLVVHK